MSAKVKGQEITRILLVVEVTSWEEKKNSLTISEMFLTSTAVRLPLVNTKNNLFFFFPFNSGRTFDSLVAGVRSRPTYCFRMSARAG